MKRVLVTGARGFIGKNLMLALGERDDVLVVGYDLGDTEGDLRKALATCDVIIHLAGVNRPPDPTDFERGNRGFTEHVCDVLSEVGRSPKIVMTSSIQAELDNPYGVSKRNAELMLERFAENAGAEVVIFRLKNVFGKWCRPNYNSVVATFCHNATHGVSLTVHDAAAPIGLVHIDDVVRALQAEIDAEVGAPGVRYSAGPSGFSTTVGELAETITRFGDVRASGMLPELGSRSIRCLYSTYLSYLEPEELAYPLDQKSDERGALAEFVKSPHAGQVFVSRTRPGITRGNHYHHCKVEKFLVVEGRARIALRRLSDDAEVAFDIDGRDLRAVDIPPGSTHTIENIGETEMVVLFWASEVFDPKRPDTYFAEVSH